MRTMITERFRQTFEKRHSLLDVSSDFERIKSRKRFLNTKCSDSPADCYTQQRIPSGALKNWKICWPPAPVKANLIKRGFKNQNDTTRDVIADNCGTWDSPCYVRIVPLNASSTIGDSPKKKTRRQEEETSGAEKYIYNEDVGGKQNNK